MWELNETGTVTSADFIFKPLLCHDSGDVLYESVDTDDFLPRSNCVISAGTWQQAEKRMDLDGIIFCGYDGHPSLV